jgi:hypothetical protein
LTWHEGNIASNEQRIKLESLGRALCCEFFYPIDNKQFLGQNRAKLQLVEISEACP